MPEFYALPDNKLSPSRVSMFGHCPACFEWQYVLRQPVRIHVALPRGVAVHVGVHAARKQVMAGDQIAIGDCLALAHDSLFDELDKIDPAMLDLGSLFYQSGADAAGHVRDLTEQAIRQIVMVRDARVGIVAVESRVDYSHIFPFEFEAYLDALLVGGIFPDLKTSSKVGQPDVWAYTQLRLYSLPWFLDGQPTQLVIDQVALPTPKNPIPRVSFFEAEASPEKYEATRKLVLDTAAAISTGIFPARPGFWCKTDHRLAA
jgi:hypothetical protein